MPFVIAAAIVAVLVWHAGWRRQDLVERLSAWSARLRQRPARAALSPRTHTETT
jgi:glutathione S-transferase